MFKKKRNNNQFDENDIRQKLINNLQEQKHYIEACIGLIKHTGDNLHNINLPRHFISSEYYESLYHSLENDQVRTLFDVILTECQMCDMLSALEWNDISDILTHVYSEEYRSDRDHFVRLLIIKDLDSLGIIPDKKESKDSIYNTLKMVLEDSCFGQFSGFSNSIMAIIFSIADKGVVKELCEEKCKDEIFEIIMEMDGKEIFPFLRKMEFDDDYFSPNQNTKILKKMTHDDTLQWYNDITKYYIMPGKELFNLFGINGLKYLFDIFPEQHEMNELIIPLLKGTIDNETYYQLYVRLGNEQRNYFLEILYSEQQYSIIRSILTTLVGNNEKVSLNEKAILTLVEKTEN